MPITGKTKILVIDDEIEIRSCLKSMLERRGYCVYTAENGEEGLEKIKELDIEIIFCDIVMPKLSGIDFLKAVHNYNLAAQVIIVTGKPDLDDSMEAVRYGAADYLIKPVEIEDLLKCIIVAERNIYEKKEMVRRVIKLLDVDKANDILRHLLKIGANVEAKEEEIKKLLSRDN